VLRTDLYDLATLALTAIADGSVVLEGEVAERIDAVRAEALVLSGQRLSRGSPWDTDVWDHMPLALSHVAQRPLHILEGDVGTGQVRVLVHTAAVYDMAPPITVVRSGSEYRVEHYDLVTDCAPS
jgi:hypothetical protein